MKRVFILALTLVLTLSLAACGNNNSTSPNNTSDSTVSIDDTITPSTNITSMPPSNIETSTPASSPAPINADTPSDEGMNLTQIQEGDYSSLLGTWTMVAWSGNAFDGTGQQWHVDAPDGLTATLSVSTDKMVFNDSAFVMQGNTLTDDAGSHPLEFFIDNDGSLGASLADADKVAINWAVTFYPKGVENDIQPNNGVQIDNTKNLIGIFYSGMRHEIVFAQTDPNS